MAARLPAVASAALLIALSGALCFASPSQARAQAAPTAVADAALIVLGPGDGLLLSVYGQSDMGGPLVVAEDGSVSLPLVGNVPVKGLSIALAQQRIEQRYRDAEILKDPHITLQLTDVRSQRVSVLGEIAKPGRYVIESDTSLLELIAQAGGIGTSGGDILTVIRPQPDGSMSRHDLRLSDLEANQQLLAAERPVAGDTYMIQKAEQFYMYGEITRPSIYRLETDLTVLQAIALAGGITARGSENRIEIKRTLPNGKTETFRAKPSDKIVANDVIRVKESIF